MIERFIQDYMQTKTANTARAIDGALRDFCAERKYAVTDLAKATPLDVVGYLAALTTRDLAPATIRARYYTLSGLWRALELSGLAHNIFPAGKPALPRSRVQVRPTALLTKAEIHKILELPHAHTRQGVSDRAMLALLFGGGLRRSEATALNVGDVVVNERGVLWLEVRRSKGGCSRRQPLSTALAEIVTLLVAQRKVDGANEHDALLVLYRAGEITRLSDSGIYRRFKFYAGHACHSARASAATAPLDAGNDYGTVSRFLGHSGVYTVASYDKRRIPLERHPGRLLNY